MKVEERVNNLMKVRDDLMKKIQDKGPESWDNVKGLWKDNPQHEQALLQTVYMFAYCEASYQAQRLLTDLLFDHEQEKIMLENENRELKYKVEAYEAVLSSSDPLKDDGEYTNCHR